MDYRIEIAISVIMCLVVLIELIRVRISRKDENGYLLMFFGFSTMIFGMYLWVTNGYILDYGTNAEIVRGHSRLMYYVGLTDILAGFLFIPFFILRELIRFMRM